LQLRYFHQTARTLSSKSETEDKDEKQLHQPSEEVENQKEEINAGRWQLLAKNYISIGGNHNLNIKCLQGGSGQKYIRIQINLQVSN
jgi:hypothetical protein